MSHENLSIRQVIQNRDFQNWLNEMRIMPRSSMTDQAVSSNPSSATPKNQIQKMLHLLMKNYGYLLSQEEISQVLYGCSNPSTINAVAAHGHLIRNKWGHSLHTHHAARIGWGAGIKDFHLTHDDLPIVYKLWEEMWNYVDIKTLGKTLYGAVDSTAERAVKLHIRKLRNNLFPHTKARITINRTQAGVYYYKLGEADDEEFLKSPLKTNLPPYLNFEFQDWLASNEVMLLTRAFEDQRIKKRNNAVFTELESDLLKILQKNHGYLISQEAVWKELQKNNSDITNLRYHIKNIRAKLLQPEDIYTANNIGLGVQIKNLRLSKNLLSLLYILWENPQEDITLESLESELKKHGEKILIPDAMHELKTKLEKSDYRIVSTKHAQKGKTMYQLLLIKPRPNTS